MMMEKPLTIMLNEPLTLHVVGQQQEDNREIFVGVLYLSPHQYHNPQAPLLSCYLERHKQDSLLSHRGKSYMLMCQNMGNKLKAHLGERYATVRMDEVDVKLCREFIQFLRNTQTSKGKPLSAASINHYFGVFKSMLAAAVKDEVIARNPIDQMKRGELPERPATPRNYLDAAELAKLTATPCRNDEVRRAFLFSCLTGLRIGDIRRLTWDNIFQRSSDHYYQMVMQKTQTLHTCKLSSAAYVMIDTADRQRQTVFNLPSLSTVERILRQWTEQAGITKHVTFHTARHSYATIALMAGSDIYTVSRLLGHKNIRTTTVYATVVDAQRDAATDGVSLLYQQHLDELQQT